MPRALGARADGMNLGPAAGITTISEVAWRDSAGPALCDIARFTVPVCSLADS